MIRSSIVLTLTFCILLALETSVLWVFDDWIAFIPLMMTSGLLVLQRVGIPEGIVWFLALAILRGDFVSAIIAMLGPLFMIKIFSTRSLYALLGVGLVAHGFGIVILWVIHGFVHGLFHVTWNISFSTLWIQELLLIPTLYLGTMLIRSFRRTIGSRVALKPLS